MKNALLAACAALFVCFFLALLPADRPVPAEPAGTAAPAELREEAPPPSPAPAPAAEQIRLLLPDGRCETMDMQDYLVGVTAAEMPALFPPEALKAQAVAARSYALWCAAGHKHGEADLCADPGCCQAWQDESALREKWGEDYALYAGRVRAAVEATAGEYLCYGGRPVFAAFHASSAGATEDCGQVWNPQPYLVSVPSPESAETVPNFVTSVRCAALDFRDTILSAHPEADFSGPAADWLGELTRDESGRVGTAVIGGVPLKGTELRRLFSLRSAAFTLEYGGGDFLFTVSGSGHGVGMSQYGARLMAEAGSGYREILAHYYPGTTLVQ